jgi:type II secretory pathway component PulF
MSTPFFVNTVAVGEEGGRVGEALAEVASYYERSVERSLQTLATLLEPTLIVMIGLIVGFIVMAVLLPIFEMSAIR